MTPIVASAAPSFIGPNATLHEVLGRYWPTFAVALGVSLAATPLARRAAFRWGVLDRPDDRVKTHGQPVAYLGGVAVLTGFLAAAAVGGWLISARTADPRAGHVLVAIAAGAILAAAVGLLDDLWDLRPGPKALGQGACALFLVMAGIRPDLQGLVRPLGIVLPEPVHETLAYLVVLFFVLGATNSLNLLDGLDGLCAGVTAIITVGFLFLAVHLATWTTDRPLDPIRVVVSLALVGSVLGFLVFNRHPAVIFLGDAGSILLGYLIAALMMLFASWNARWWSASIFIFGLPILDTATAVIRRLVNRRPLFQADRGHIYDQMIDRGIGLRRTVRINYLLAAAYTAAGVACAVLLRTRYAIPVYLAAGGASFLVVWRTGYFRMAGLRGAVRRDPPGEGPPADDRPGGDGAPGAK